MKSKFVMFLQVATITITYSFVTPAAAQISKSIAGCTIDSFVQGTENNQINTTGMTYTPKCLKIKVGATVTIQANSRHPLLAMPDINKAINPFSTNSSYTTPQTRKMNEPGLYGYFCDRHGDSSGDGMAGVIMVEL